MIPSHFISLIKRLTVWEEPGSSSLEVLARLSEVDEESLPLPCSWRFSTPLMYKEYNAFVFLNKFLVDRYFIKRRYSLWREWVEVCLFWLFGILKRVFWGRTWTSCSSVWLPIKSQCSAVSSLISKFLTRSPSLTKSVPEISSDSISTFGPCLWCNSSCSHSTIHTVYHDFLLRVTRCWLKRIFHSTRNCRGPSLKWDGTWW